MSSAAAVNSDLDARPARTGAPPLEGTEALAGKTVPTICFAARKINNNFDVVDAVCTAHQRADTAAQLAAGSGPR